MGRLSNRDVDAVVQMEYEDALADEEPWAVQSFEYRQEVVKSAVTPATDDWLAPVVKVHGQSRDHSDEAAGC